MKTIRRWLYRRGYRPRRGSIFYSPSQAFIYAYIDEKHPGAIIRYKRR